MPTSEHTLWNAALTVLLGIVGFFMRAFHQRVENAHERADKAAQQLHETRELLIRDYVSKDHIEQRLDRLETKLDRLIQERTTR